MKKKIILPLFIAASLAMCLVPSVGMIFRPTDQTLGNETQTKLPSLTGKDGGLNTSYPAQLGDYFDKHFAFRPEAIMADAVVQSKLFGRSNIDTVVTGKNGWLYYSSTADDFLGRNTLSESEISAVVRNLEIINDYSQSQGARFIFTVPPNKNTLYPDNMPYYYGVKAGDVHNRDLLNSALENSSITYVNLFKLFESQDETLYFERDSHWNNKGALLAYNEIMEHTGKVYDDYSSAQVSRRKDFNGDLANMLYPLGAEPEYNYYYGAEERYEYLTETESVEESMIRTFSPNSTGKLYMYRDSFGNALLPFMAGAYGSATFTKAFPMILSSELEQNKPDVFIMELVERNIDWLVTRPPVLPAPRLTIDSVSEGEGELELSVQPCEYAPAEYYTVSGSVKGDIADGRQIYIEVRDSESNTACHQCFGTLSEDGSGFTAYLKAEDYRFDGGLDISVIMKDDESGYVRLGTDKVITGGNYEG